MPPAARARWTAPDGCFSVAHPSNRAIGKIPTPATANQPLLGEFAVSDIQAECRAIGRTDAPPTLPYFLAVVARPDLPISATVAPSPIVRQQPVHVAGQARTKTLLTGEHTRGLVAELTVPLASRPRVLVGFDITEGDREALFDAFVVSLPVRLGDHARYAERFAQTGNI